MPRRRAIATVRDLLRRATKESHGTSKLVREGRRAAYSGEGGGSLFAWPFLAGARKIKGKEAVNRALYERYHRPLKNVDEKLGRLLERELGTKKLFRQVDVLPTRRTMGRAKHRALIQHETHSATAPLTKAVGVISPLAATLYVAEKLDKRGREKMASSTEQRVEDKDVLLKEAADALEMAQKRDEAVKLAFQMVERGKVAPFGSYGEFQEKVASLMQKDLRVVEEALDMDVDMPDFGKVASTGDVPLDATAAFFHRLAED
jgi:hypothetical protein